MLLITKAKCTKITEAQPWVVGAWRPAMSSIKRREAVNLAYI